MNTNFDYDKFFSITFNQIKLLRDPRSSRPDSIYTVNSSVNDEVLIDFGSRKYYEYSYIVSNINDITQKSIIILLRSLFDIYNHKMRYIDKINKTQLISSSCICGFLDKMNNELLIIKEVENVGYYDNKEVESNLNKEFNDRFGSVSFKFVYLLYDKAYLQCNNYNDDINSPSRGTIAYDFKWLFNTYFNNDEYNKFKNAFEQYKNRVNDYLGYFIVESLNPNALISFRDKIKSTITEFNYSKLKQEPIKYKGKSFKISDLDYKILYSRFFSKKNYLLLLGTSIFAQSLVTAEWLYTYLKDAGAIDFTVVGIGFFKAVEQLLCNIICLHTNENREIKEINSKNKIDVSKENIYKEEIDFSIGSMAVFFRDNPDILNENVSNSTKEYIKESIFKYADLRNSYLHKVNANSWNEIDKIRYHTFNLIFLILGSIIISDDDLIQLGHLSTEIFDDYYKLCEYMHYHRDELFYITHTDDTHKVVEAQIFTFPINNGDAIDEEMANNLFFSCGDMYHEIIDKKFVKYSGVYIRHYNDKTSSGDLITREMLCSVDSIYLVNLRYTREFLGIDLEIKKIIFQNGKFINDEDMNI